jgi:hypothetical protein
MRKSKRPGSGRYQRNRRRAPQETQGNSAVSKEARNIKAFETLVKVAAHGGPPPVDVPQTFSVGKISPFSGNWYFCATCPDCGNITPAFRDESQGNLRNYFSNCSLMQLHLRCRQCQCHIQIPAKDLRVVQWE